MKHRQEAFVLRPRIIFLTAAVWLALHGIIWWLVYQFEPTIYPYARSMLEYWDAWHYNAIIKEGYSGIRWAFYPLYPMLVKALAWSTGLRARPEIAGTIFSTLAFAAFCSMQAWLAAAPDEKQGLLKPVSVWGWLFFLFSPASWVFHSHHTESLFLLLSFAALLASSRGSWKTAALIAGLCALMRNQGVFLAVAVALDSAWRHKEFRQRARFRRQRVDQFSPVRLLRGLPVPANRRRIAVRPHPGSMGSRQFLPTVYRHALVRQRLATFRLEGLSPFAILLHH